jgi:hypothetical protein
MQAPPEFGFEQLITELLRGLADAVADRPGETEAQRFARHRTAIFSTMAFLPRDAIETMLAGQCVIFDLLLRDAARDLLRNEAAATKLRIRSQLTAMGRLFLKHLDQLRQLQSRPVQQAAASPDAEPESPSNPSRQTSKTAASRTVSAVAGSPTTNADPVASQASPAEVEPASDASQPQATPSGGKADLLLQRGFQNRRTRRALQFKKPASKPASRRSSGLAAASQPATGAGPAGA